MSKVGKVFNSKTEYDIKIRGYLESVINLEFKISKLKSRFNSQSQISDLIMPLKKIIDNHNISFIPSIKEINSFDTFKQSASA